MRIPQILFATALGMCAVVVVAFLIAEPADSHGFPHPDYPTMEQGGCGLERHGPILWLGWIFGVLEILFFVAAMALAARKREDLRGLGKPLLWGAVAYLAVWTLQVVAYRGYMTDPDPALFLAFPAPTAVMMYGLWGVPIIFMALYFFGFDRWILTDEDVEEFERLLAAKRDAEQRATQRSPGGDVEESGEAPH